MAAFEVRLWDKMVIFTEWPDQLEIETVSGD